MRQISVLLLASLILLPSCQKRDTVTPPKIHGGAMISPTPDGLGVTISWQMAAEVDGYAIITPYNDTISLGYTNIFTDEQPTATGIYYICTICGPFMAIFDSVSDAPYESDSTAFVYVWGSDEGPSGFGWNTTTGIGTSYDCSNEHKDVIDFFLQQIEFPLYFISADEPPFNGNKTICIQIMWEGDFFAAPDSNYNPREMAYPELHYAVRLEGNYYAKVFEVVEGCHTIIGFEYKLQTIQGLRIF